MAHVEHSAVRNRLLKAMTAYDFARLQPHLELVDLQDVSHGTTPRFRGCRAYSPTSSDSQQTRPLHSPHRGSCGHQVYRMAKLYWVRVTF